MDRKLERKLDDALNTEYGPTAEIAFKQLVSSLKDASQIYFSPVGGYINRVTVSWPAGCNFLVEVIFRHKTVQFIPTPDTGGTGNKGIALDNFTETLNPHWPIRQNDPIEMYIVNHDREFDHTISAVVHISDKREFFR